MAKISLPFILWPIICVCVQYAAAERIPFNLSAYHELPQLYTLDDYNVCLFNSNVTRAYDYCVVYAEIEPNNNSTYWQKINYFSKDFARQYRHDHLYFGICLQRCELLLTNTTKSHFNHHVEAKELIAYYADVHQRVDSAESRARYARLIGDCLNYEFQQQHFGLKLRTSIEYCNGSERKAPIDTLELIFYCVCVCIAILCLLCSLYDYHLCCIAADATVTTTLEGFYATELTSRKNRLLTSFSLYRNYQRLTKNSQGSPPTSDNLRSLSALRVLGSCVVIFAHTLLLFMTAPISNPEFFEQFFYRYEIDILQNGTAFIQIFFVISGFMLQLHYNVITSVINAKTSAGTCLTFYLKAVAYRLFRLLPSLVTVMLFSATILTRLHDGPLWQHYTEAERTFCRRYWWKNIFFLNNNNALQQSCLQHTWYLACDMQLYYFFLAHLMLMAKFPRCRRLMIIELLLLAFIVPSVITYVEKLQPIYHITPESYRYLYFKENANVATVDTNSSSSSSSFFLGYTTFYMNLGGYYFGLLSAIYYMSYRNNSDRTKLHISSSFRWLYELFWWCLFPIGFALLFVAGAIMRSIKTHEISSIYLALFAGLYRNVWALLFAVGIISLCCYQLGCYKLSRLSIFRILSRLSYQSYLWHVIILRLIIAQTQQTFYINRIYMLYMFVAIYILTQIVAFVMALLIEYPFAVITKNLL